MLINQYKSSVTKNIKTRPYLDIFEEICNKYQNNYLDYVRSNHYTEMEKRLQVESYNKTIDTAKSLSRILEVIPVCLFDLHRNTLIPRCVNHYKDNKLFNEIRNKFNITDEEINSAEEKIKSSKSNDKTEILAPSINNTQSDTKKKVSKLQNWNSISEEIMENANWVAQDDWIFQSKIKREIEWLTSQEYINKSIESIFNQVPEFVYKNCNSNNKIGSYQISPDLIQFIKLIYWAKRNTIKFWNNNWEIEKYLESNNISLEDYILQNYTLHKDLVSIHKVNRMWIILESLTLKLI